MALGALPAADPTWTGVFDVPSEGRDEKARQVVAVLAGRPGPVPGTCASAACSCFARSTALQAVGTVVECGRAAPRCSLTVVASFKVTSLAWPLGLVASLAVL